MCSQQAGPSTVATQRGEPQPLVHLHGVLLLLFLPEVGTQGLIQHFGSPQHTEIIYGLLIADVFYKWTPV